MAAGKDKNGKNMNLGATANGGRKTASPGWASGLRQLYDSVVEEPLPDSFKDLISKLDRKD